MDTVHKHVDRLDVYRVVDAVFRVHRRLYNINSALVSLALINVKTAKNNSISKMGILSAFWWGTITLFSQYSDMT